MPDNLHARVLHVWHVQWQKNTVCNRQHTLMVQGGGSQRPNSPWQNCICSSTTSIICAMRQCCPTWRGASAAWRSQPRRTAGTCSSDPPACARAGSSSRTCARRAERCRVPPSLPPRRSGTPAAAHCCRRLPLAPLRGRQQSNASASYTRQPARSYDNNPEMKAMQ